MYSHLPTLLSFSLHLQGCNLAYATAMARHVNRWTRRWCEWLDTQRDRGSAFCHSLGKNLSLIILVATADFKGQVIKRQGLVYHADLI